MWVPVLHINYDTLSHAAEGDDSEAVRKKVCKARDFARARFKQEGATLITKNKDMKAKDINTHVKLDEECLTLMKKMADSFLLSPRAYHRVLRLARTIADYRGSLLVQKEDILEAFQYRPKLYQDRL
jgi:magnesium chelatase family protein